MTNKEIINEIKPILSELDYGEDAVSYLTQNDVKWLNENIKALEQEPCEDAISRAEVIKAIDKHTFEIDDGVCLDDDITCILEDLPSVRPQQQIGNWIMIDKELQRYKCSECGEVIKLYKKSEIPKLEKDETLSDYPFSHCGCKMVESQESEE